MALQEHCCELAAILSEFRQKYFVSAPFVYCQHSFVSTHNTLLAVTERVVILTALNMGLICF